MCEPKDFAIKGGKFFDANEHLIEDLYNIEGCKSNGISLEEDNLQHYMLPDDQFLTQEEANVLFDNDVEFNTIEDVKQHLIDNVPLFKKVITILAFCYNACNISGFKECEELLRIYGYEGLFLTEEEFARRQDKHAKEDINRDIEAMIVCEEQIVDKLNERSGHDWSLLEYIQHREDTDIKQCIQTMCEEYNQQKIQDRNERNIVGWNKEYETLLRQLGYRGELPSNYYGGCNEHKKCFDYENQVPYDHALKVYHLVYDETLDYSMTHMWMDWSIEARRKEYELERSVE